MSEEEETPVPKPSKKFVLRNPTPFTVHFSNIGDVEVSHLRYRDAATFRKDLPDPAGASDEEVARKYIGAVCRVPVGKAQQEQRRLTDEEIERVTADDLNAFAIALAKSDHAIMPKDQDNDLHSLAQAIRRQRQLSDKSDEQLREAMGRFGRGLSPEVLQSIQQTSSLAEQLRAQVDMFSNRSLVERLIGAQSLSQVAQEALQQNNLQAHIREASKISLLNPINIDSIRVPELPPVEKTPIGRTAAATEELVAVARDAQAEMHLAGAHLASLATH